MTSDNNKNFKSKRMLTKAHNLSTDWIYKNKDRDDFDKNSLILLDNVQFIYELALAQLELESLNIDFLPTNSLRKFKLISDKNLDKLIKKTAYFKIVGEEYSYYFRIIQKNVTRSVNQYLTHWIYPYKGKFHPQMIRALLNIIDLKEGDTVLDPFVGSGTTAVEAKLLGINCIGIDISPICVLQSEIKTESLEIIDEIERNRDRIINKLDFNPSDHKDKTFLEIIDSISNEKVKNFYKMAYLVAVSDNTRRGRNFKQSFYKNLNLMIKSVKDFKDIANKLKLKLGETKVTVGDSRYLPLEDESVDGIITSPPYSIALDYVANDAHALKVLGYDPLEMREQFIGLRGRGSERIDLYNQDMEKSYKEIFRVLKPKKFIAIIIGNATYMGEEVKTVEFTIDCCQKIGFKLIKNIDKIIFGLYNVMQKENILIFQKI
jgi:DNA modification methylase